MGSDFRIAKYLFLDLETTGLNRDKCGIVEIGVCLTDDQFEPVPGEFQSIVYPIDVFWESAPLKMHSDNGLISDLQRSGPFDLHMVEDRLCTFIETRRTNTQPLYLAGNSVHFDRMFLEKFMPKVLSFVGHRQLDVTSLRLLGQSLKIPEQTHVSNHRAMDDVRASIREAKYWRSSFGGVSQPTAPVMSMSYYRKDKDFEDVPF